MDLMLRLSQEFDRFFYQCRVLSGEDAFVRATHALHATPLGTSGDHRFLEVQAHVIES